MPGSDPDIDPSKHPPGETPTGPEAPSAPVPAVTPPTDVTPSAFPADAVLRPGVPANAAAPPGAPTPKPGRAPETEEDAAVRSARACVHQLARTLKICRLYESSSSPTVARFIEDLATMLEAYLELRGRLELRFTANDVLFQDVSVYPAKTREDNLALPFYQDGIRRLAFEPGLLRRELQTVLDAVLRVTSAKAGDDDLVTLLWEAHLEHVELQYVPAEGDLGAGLETEDSDEPMGWPEPGTESGENDSVSQASIEEEGSSGDNDRSDDWSLDDLTAEVEAGYAELEQLSVQEVPRFIRDYEAEHEVPLTTTAIAIVQSYLSVTEPGADHSELGHFVPRVLREALDNGRWLEASEALGILTQIGSEQWSRQTFQQEILQPVSIARFVTVLDQQDERGLAEFVGFAETMDITGLDFILGVLAEIQTRRHRRLLCKVVEEWAGDEPQRLGAWIADPRWHVVRNIAYILGQIGTQATVPLLATLTEHPEPRVQQEAVNALGRVDPWHTRSIFKRLLEHRDPKVFVAAVTQLALARDHELARMFVQFLTHPDFAKRSDPERRAIYRAVSQTGGSEVVRDLEAELHRGSWLARNAEEHRQEVARCLAEIGGADARAALDRGAQSRRTPVRRAAEIALAIFDSPRRNAA